MGFPVGWTKYQTIPINGSSDGELTDYQVEITVPFQSGMKSDFGDIRFLDSDMVTLLPYHLVSYTANTSAIFVVKIPVIPTIGKNIRIYFGNSTATTTSDPDNVYLLYDDLSSDEFLNYGSATHSVANNQLTVGGTEGIVYHPGLSLSGDFILEFNQISPTSGNYWMEIVLLTTGNRRGYLHITDGAYYGNGSSWSLIKSVTAIPRGTGVKHIKFRKIGNNYKIFVDDVEKDSFSHSTLTNGYLGFRTELSKTFVYSGPIKVYKTTTNPPGVGTFGSVVDFSLEAAYFRAKLISGMHGVKSHFRGKFKVVEDVVSRFRGKFEIAPEKVRFRTKLMIREEKFKQFRAKFRTITSNPTYTSAIKRFRAKIEAIPIEKKRFRAKVNIDSGKTRLELFANVKLRQSEFEDSFEDFEFTIGDQKYDT
jgi:hypothetical protein